MISNFLNQTFLEPRQRFLFLRDRGKGLDVGNKKILAKGQAQDIKILTAITEGTRQSHKHCRKKGSEFAWENKQGFLDR